MNSWIDFFYFFICGAALLLSVLALWFTIIMPGIDRWSKRFFLLFFTVLMLNCFSALLETVLLRYPVPIPPVIFLLVLESLFLALPLPMLTVYLLHCSGEDIRNSRLFRTVTVLWAVYFVLVAASPFTGSFSYITPDRQYFRGPLYPLLLLPMTLTMLLNLAGTIRRRKHLSRKTYQSFLSALLPMTVALLVHTFVDVYALLDICIVLSALSMYSLVLSDQIEQDLCQQREIARHQREIADQRASIMVLQMRPHFIYNTMTSIYCLCNQIPDAPFWIQTV